MLLPRVNRIGYNKLYKAYLPNFPFLDYCRLEGVGPREVLGSGSEIFSLLYIASRCLCMFVRYLPAPLFLSQVLSPSLSIPSFLFVSQLDIPICFPSPARDVMHGYGYRL